jgi:Arc/MetJ family transcription regulator
MAHSVKDIDESALAEAQRVLGTRTTKDTVNAALREVARGKLVAEFLGEMSSRDPEELERLREEAWH